MPEVLAVAEEFFRERVAPLANRLDTDTGLLRETVIEMSAGGLMSLRRPAAYGGPELGEVEFRRFQEQVASTSGALSFLQTQHQSAVAMIAKNAPDEFKLRVLPGSHQPQGWIAIGFSQLRRAGEPIFRAEKTSGGYVLNGHVPWITGHTIFPRCLVGAQLPSGEAVFGLVPFSDQAGEQGQIRCSEPMRLAAMQAAQTVTADVTDWFLPEHDVAFVQPNGWIHANDMVNVTLQSWFALGCARAGLDLVKQAAEKRQNPQVRAAFEALDRELADCRQRTSELDRPLEERLSTRAQAIDLASRCALAGVAVSGGAANSVDHPAQRIYRESLVYCVSAQTVPILEATLARLVFRGRD